MQSSCRVLLGKNSAFWQQNISASSTTLVFVRCFCFHVKMKGPCCKTTSSTLLWCISVLSDADEEKQLEGEITGKGNRNSPVHSAGTHPNISPMSQLPPLCKSRHVCIICRNEGRKERGELARKKTVHYLYTAG